MERWVPVVGYEGLYEVSDLGRVRSLDRVVGDRQRRIRGVVLKGTPRSLRGTRGGINTRLGVCLCKGGKTRTHFVHALVLAAFVGPRPDGYQACHGPGGPQDNRLSNLRWDTPESNWDDRRDHDESARGERVGSAKLTEEQVLEIRELYAKGGVTHDELGERFGVTGTMIGYIVRRQWWRHV
jgi:hypothetical protein